jgi:hypothetical protein
MVGKRFSADSSTVQMLLDLESQDEIISQFMRGSSQGRKFMRGSSQGRKIK